VGAQKKIVQKPSEFRGCVGTLKLPAPEAEKNPREDQVHDDKNHEHDRQEHRPRCVDQVQVGMNVAPGGAAPLHVEASILIDRAPQRT